MAISDVKILAVRYACSRYVSKVFARMMAPTSMVQEVESLRDRDIGSV